MVIECSRRFENVPMLQSVNETWLRLCNSQKNSQLRGITQEKHTAKDLFHWDYDVTQRKSDEFFIFLVFRGVFQKAYPNMSSLSFQPVL
jgi:hypothetical protein